MNPKNKNIPPLRQIGLICKKGNPRAREAAQDLIRWLGTRAITFIEEDPEAIRSSDMILVLGGDGTLLSAARQFGEGGPPILGINLGGLGFLTEVNVEEITSALEQILAGNYELEFRMLLKAQIWRDQELLTSATILNDVVLNKGALARIIDLSTYINGEFLNVFRGDGLIISTPTGSTAYNLAAGGPVLHPTLETIVITPICPFTLSNRPLILPDTTQVRITIGEKAQDVFITFDGQVGAALQPKDRIEIAKADQKLKLIKSPFRSYFEILRNKLKWG
jgi:NAD+ kinase